MYQNDLKCIFFVRGDDQSSAPGVRQEASTRDRRAERRDRRSHFSSVNIERYIPHLPFIPASGRMPHIYNNKNDHLQTTDRPDRMDEKKKNALMKTVGQLAGHDAAAAAMKFARTVHIEMTPPNPNSARSHWKFRMDLQSRSVNSTVQASGEIDVVSIRRVEY